MRGHVHAHCAGRATLLVLGYAGMPLYICSPLRHQPVSHQQATLFSNGCWTVLPEPWHLHPSLNIWHLCARSCTGSPCGLRAPGPHIQCPAQPCSTGSWQFAAVVPARLHPPLLAQQSAASAQDKAQDIRRQSLSPHSIHSVELAAPPTCCSWGAIPGFVQDKN